MWWVIALGIRTWWLGWDNRFYALNSFEMVGVEGTVGISLNWLWIGKYIPMDSAGRVWETI